MPQVVSILVRTLRLWAALLLEEEGRVVAGRMSGNYILFVSFLERLATTYVVEILYSMRK